VFEQTGREAGRRVSWLEKVASWGLKPCLTRTVFVNSVPKRCCWRTGAPSTLTGSICHRQQGGHDDKPHLLLEPLHPEAKQ
jgi:hypothetical protein